MSFFKRLKDGLFKTSTKISEGVKNIFVRKRVTAETLEDLEELLITADLGMTVTKKMIDAVKAKKYHKDIEISEIQSLMAEEVEKILAPLARPLNLFQNNDAAVERESADQISLENLPNVILVVGVNGAGKTTTIAKYAQHFKEQKKKVLLIAADTFRAAAVDQLEVWAERTGVALHQGKQDADPASVVFEGMRKGKDFDIVMIDTAGRLHNKTHLMEELRKIRRVLQKINVRYPRETILVLDATTGQNALEQVEAFAQTTPLSGLIMTKLDGTAKGGILVAIAEKYKLPIYAIGVGERADDLQPFDAHMFSLNLVGLDETSS